MNFVLVSKVVFFGNVRLVRNFSSVVLVMFIVSVL